MGKARHQCEALRVRHGQPRGREHRSLLEVAQALLGLCQVRPKARGDAPVPRGMRRHLRADSC